MRVLVCTDPDHVPETALTRGRSLAGRRGHLVLEVVIPVPLAQATTSLAPGALERGCRVLERAERFDASAAADDTRLVRARTVGEGVLNTLSQERFDVVMLELPQRARVVEDQAALACIVESATTRVILVRPGHGGPEVGRPAARPA